MWHNRVAGDNARNEWKIYKLTIYPISESDQTGQPDS